MPAGSYVGVMRVMSLLRSYDIFLSGHDSYLVVRCLRSFELGRELFMPACFALCRSQLSIFEYSSCPQVARPLPHRTPSVFPIEKVNSIYLSPVARS